jgi:hypothetical protein
MKVLVAGMENLHNQFGRQLKKYGLDVVHTDADPGKFPTDCDAVILVICHLSHQKFKDVKNYYKHRQTFSTNNGFSEIKRQFEDWLLGATPVKESKTAMAEAFKEAATNERPPRRYVHTQEVLDKVKTIVKECFEAGMDTRETAEYLKHEGHKKASGGDYEVVDVSGIKNRMGITLAAAKGIDQLPPALASAPLLPAVQEVKAQEHMNAAEYALVKRMELIGKVLANGNLSEERKVKLVESIYSGRMATEFTYSTRKVREHGQECIQITEISISNESDKPALTLTRAECGAIIEVLDDIKKFREGK